MSKSKKILLERIIFFIILILTFLLSKQSLNTCLLLSGISLILYFILYAIYKLVFYKRTAIFTKNNKIFVLCYIIFFNILFYILEFKNLTMFNNDSLIIFMNFYSMIISILTLFQYSKRKVNSRNANLSLLISSIVFPLIYWKLKTNLIFSSMSMTVFLFYILEGYDYSSPKRKKNYFRIGLASILLFALAFINKFCLIIILSLFLNFLIKNNKKKYIFQMGIMLFFSIAGLLLSSFVNINPTIIDNSNLLTLISVILMTLMVISLFVNTLILTRISCKKICLFITLYLLLVLIFDLDIIYLVSLFPLAINIISLTYNGEVLFRIDLKKYIRTPLEKVKKVSVVIPNYNYAHYIIDRINSVLKQNYPIYELIVLDDCSTDNSEEVITSYLDEIKNRYENIIIKYIPNKKNSGNVFKQWAKCFEVASGDYVWICEADDLCSKYFLNVVMRGFENNDVVMSYSESLAIDENGKVFKKNLRDWIDIYSTGRWNQNYIVSGNDELSKVMCINNTIANVSSVVFKNDKKIKFTEYLKVSQEFTLAGDWYFYSKVLLKGSIAYFSESLNYHRMHSNSVTTTTDNFIHYKEIISVQESIKKDVKIDETILKRIAERDAMLRRDMCINDDELKYDKIDLKKLVKEKKIKDKVLLSIIIPVYGTEQYLKKCLKSVFTSLPEKTEVIVINDGSPDNSEEIILDFAKKYSSLKYIKKKNGGLSSVKNRGLKEAKGRYVIYLDSDDFVSSNMHSTMLKKAIDTDADFVYCDVLMTFEDGSVRYCTMKNYDRKDKLMQLLDNNLMAASWNKMIKKELYDGLVFPEEFNNEDIAVSPVIALRAKRIEYIQSPFYKYVQRKGSIQNSEFSEKRFMVFDTTKICLDRINKYSNSIKKKIEGVLLTQQILSLLIFPIAEIKDNNMQLKMIQKFCERFYELDYKDDNEYVDEFLNKFKRKDLVKFINDGDYIKLQKYINRM